MPIKVSGYYDGLDASSQYTITVNEYGRLVRNRRCRKRNTGEEFNPSVLIDVDTGLPEVGQDADLGKLVLPETDADGVLDFTDVELLLNINGWDGILGRSLTLYDSAGDVVRCCTINRDFPPPNENSL